ncbi:ubiquitin-conjugating enzyme/RWD-like protein [Apiosordaria backusii]|uniref:Ubiquitin-conjugating enzyme/RWD-like protein n=1 Tax=Apiosordaria backusii TaxID=314023 RepID=A0AA40BK28_9PEZI|nr:ubiquitin-conjugating enzyme/RWD-like protein [Apiosordaria backusii]
MPNPTPKINSKSPTIRRILKEAQELTLTPSPFFLAAPLETDLFEWHFTLLGPPSSPFASGLYHGRINLPPSYPLRPPSFRFLTPSGRFEVNREICLSISGHHEETWQPAWGIRTALVALRSFMETDVKGQLGGLEASPEVRRRLAGESRSWVMGEHGRVCGEMGVVEEGEGGGKEKVPGELRMGWRDEMGGGGGGGGDKEKGKEREGKGEEEEESDGEETARLAEGFVQTVPLQTESRTQTAARGPEPVAVSVGQPPQQQQQRPQPQLQQVQRRRTTSQDEVPVWLDRLIVAVAVLLIAAVAKVMLG